jgi:RNA polymerase sigma-70 factor (ECF subfamily)
LSLPKIDLEKITGKLREDCQENKMIQQQNKQYLIQLVNALPEEQRQVIISRHYEDLSFKEIAQKTNCSINTAIGRMRYALNNLRKMAEQQHIFLQ